MLAQLSLLDPAGLAPAHRPSPIVKWAGGKSRILPQLLPLLPPHASRLRHVEPFVGGGAMFFARRPARALLCDKNARLCALYSAISDDVDRVIGELRVLATDHTPERYYELRERFNTSAKGSKASRAALFIYLNKTCFNGLYRENRLGHFNVPAGKYENPRILDEPALRLAAAELRGVEIRCQNFDATATLLGPGDFVYLDPPYEPASSTANFTAYGQDGFSRDDQTRLRDVFIDLDRRGCKLMLSNSDVPFIRDLYNGFHMSQVSAKRSISCKGSERGTANELVVTNYPPTQIAER